MNKIKLIGTVKEKPEYSHEVLGEKFYSFILETKRKSETVDSLICVAPELLINNIEENSRIAYRHVSGARWSGPCRWSLPAFGAADGRGGFCRFYGMAQRRGCVPACGGYRRGVEHPRRIGAQYRGGDVLRSARCSDG